MKGIVFTEFLEFVEEGHGILVVDKIISKSKLESGGIYSAVGTYDHFEMVQLVTHLSEELGIPVPELLYIYGEHFFAILLKSYPSFFEKHTDSFDFLSTVDNYIHPEVLKLYPDAELPSFELVERTDSSMKLLYKSERGLYRFAEGLMIGCLKHFEDNATVTTELVDESGKQVMFEMKRS